jgi:hypothetical protein
MAMARGPGIILAGAALLVMATACVSQLDRTTPGPEGTSTPAPTAEATASPTPSPTPTATLAASTPVSPTPTPTATPTNIPIGNGGVQRVGLFLEIEGISDESIIRGDTVIARGQTVPEAVVSISFPPRTTSIIVPVQADGSFEIILSLEPGPNLIEVVASNLEGEELSRVIAVVSLPEEGSSS